MKKESRKRTTKPARTEAVGNLIKIWSRIASGEIAYADFDPPELLDDEETKKTHDLFLRVLQCNASGNTVDNALRKEVNEALKTWKRIYGNGSIAPRGLGSTFIQKGEEHDWNLIYRAQVINDLLLPYNETQTKDQKYPCNVDYFIGVCPRCGNIFERSMRNQVYDRDTCKVAVSKNKRLTD